ncbi:PspC domain-containing protein [Polaribacter haliotis]|nr:PspC domain-containing protein [Polaribacter haliotis]
MNKLKTKNMILGVCEWLSTKTQFSAKNIRIVFVLLVLFAGLGLGAYLILWLVKILSKE